MLSVKTSWLVTQFPQHHVSWMPLVALRWTYTHSPWTTAAADLGLSLQRKGVLGWSQTRALSTQHLVSSCGMGWCCCPPYPDCPPYPYCPRIMAPVDQPPQKHSYPEESPCATIWPYVVVNCLLLASKVSCNKMHPSFTEASSPFGPEQLVWQCKKPHHPLDLLI